MIRILIVDDNSNKVVQVGRVIDETLLGSEAVIEVAGSATAAFDLLRNERFDLLIVDLYIPWRADEQPIQDGGVRLFRELSRRSRINLPTHILGLTERGDLCDRYSDEFGAESWHIVLFSWTSDIWEERLRRKLLHVADGQRPELLDGYKIDLAIVTALHKIELDAVLALDGHWESDQPAGDSTIYHRGIFRRSQASMRVIAAAAPEMGMAAAAALTTKVIHRWKPRYLAMVGVAAGVKGQFGDILIADRAWDYGSGKVRAKPGGRRTRFLPAPSQVAIQQTVKAKLERFQMKLERLAAIRAAWRGVSVPKILKAQIGPLASGAAVVSSRGVIDSLVAQHRKLVGVEMETYGVFLAAEIACAPRPQAFAIKSICDFGDKRKGDRYQKYAAFTSARFLFDFALDQLAGEIPASLLQ